MNIAHLSRGQRGVRPAGSWAILVAAAVATTMLAACSSDGGEPAAPSSSASASSQSAAPSAEPDVPSIEPAAAGQCRDYGYNELIRFSNSSPVVSCADEHTAQTFFVGELPDSDKETLQKFWRRDDDGGDDSPKPTKTMSKYFKTCTTRLDEFLGRGPGYIPTKFEYAWFGPSPQSWAAGDRALRCDVVTKLMRFADGVYTKKALIALPSASMKGFVAKKSPVKWAACRTFGKAEGSGSYTGCKIDSDYYVSIGSKSLPSGNWPGDAKVNASSSKLCEKMSGDHVKDNKWRYFWEGPTKSQWKDGDRTVYCYVRATNWDRKAK